MFNSDTSTEIVKYVIAIALLILSAAASYAVVIARKHLSPSQIDTVVEIARIVTLGVEQIAPVLGLIGPAKYAEAVTRMVSLLSSHGITLSAGDIQTYIEASVRALKAAGQELVAPAAPVVISVSPVLTDGPHP